MTREEILAMEAGVSLDRLVCEVVLGWEPAMCDHQGVDALSVWTDEREWKVVGPPDAFVRPFAGFFSPSTSIADAFEVVWKLEADGWFFEFSNQEGPQAMFWQKYHRGDGVSARTNLGEYALAICRAALLAKLEAK